MASGLEPTSPREASVARRVISSGRVLFSEIRIPSTWLFPIFSIMFSIISLGTVIVGSFEEAMGNEEVELMIVSSEFSVFCRKMSC